MKKDERKQANQAKNAKKTCHHVLPKSETMKCHMGEWKISKGLGREKSFLKLILQIVMSVCQL